MKALSLLLTIILTAALLSGCSKKEPAPQPAGSDTDKPAAAEPTPTPAPETATKAQLGQKAATLDGLTYVKGQPVTLGDGKVTVVEFWATWCPPCRTSIPHLTEVQKQYADKGVTIIGISREDLDTVKPFVEKQAENMDYTVAIDTEGKISDGYMKAFGQNGIPTAFIVDGKGNVAWVGHPMGGLEEVLEQVVAGTFDPEAHAKAQAEKEAAEKQIYELYQKYMTAVKNGDPIDETRPIAEKLIEIGHSEALNAMAWQILTLPDDSQGDKEIALKAAEKANTQTEGKSPMILDTYALALFQNDKIAEAIAAQEKAITLAGDNQQMVDAMKTQLEEFQAALKTPATNP